MDDPALQARMDEVLGSIPVTSLVRLKGLKAAAYLNGAEGEIAGPPSSESESDPPRYPVRLLSPESAVAAHPQGVRVREANMDILERRRVFEFNELHRSPAGPAVSPTPAAAVEAFVAALEKDEFPPEGLDVLFGVQMPPSGRSGTEGFQGPRGCEMGQLTLGAWQEVLKDWHEGRMHAAMTSYGCTEQELRSALAYLSMGGVEALRYIGGPRGSQLAAVAKASRAEFMAEIEGAMRAGNLPRWFEAAVRRALAACGLPREQTYCGELCRRGLKRVPWDKEALAGMRAAA